MSTEPIEWLLARLDPQLHNLASRSACSEVRQSFDDLRHDLFLKLSRHPPPAEANTESYVVEAFKNLIKDRVRACNRRAKRDVEYMRPRPEACCDPVDAVTSRRELRWHIKRAVRRANLRADHRCALLAWLRDSLDEFAARRGITHKTAGVWSWRARQSLRPYLEHLRHA